MNVRDPSPGGVLGKGAFKILALPKRGEGSDLFQEILRDLM